MKYKKIIFFSLVFIFIGTSVSTDLPYKLISNLTRKTVTTTLSVKFACSTTGSESTLTVKATSIENTSGIDNWYCHNYNTGNWVACPSSFNCSTYSLIGWNGYDKVKAFDKAGNESSEVDLYNITSTRASNYNSKLGTLFAVNIGTNPVHIIDYKADIGTITNAQIKNGKIKLTGTPGKNTVNKLVDNYFAASKDYLCKFGKPIEKDGSWICDATNYRLQNETCSCLFDVNNGSYTLKSSGCLRDSTFCSDNYNKDASLDDTFKVITKPNQDVSKNCTQDELNDGNHIDCYSSTYFDRQLHTSCFTYYKNSNFKRVFAESWYDSYDIYISNMKDRNGNYRNGDVDETAKKVIVDASKDINNLCSTDNQGANKANDKSDYISAARLFVLCEDIEKKLNAGEKISGSTTKQDQFMVPFVGSAQCIFNNNKATSESNLNKYKNYAQVNYDYNNNSVYYCNNGELVEKDGTYQCKVTAVSQITTYAYDWTVNYYRKK